MITVSKLKYISLILIIITVTRFNDYFFDALNRSFGIPPLRYTYLHMFLLPCAYIMNISIQKWKFKTPNLLFYLLFVGSHYYMEKNMYGITYKPDYDLITRTFPLYFAYVAMVNYGVTHKDYFKILKVSLSVILLVSSLFYLDFIGILDLGGLVFIDDDSRMAGVSYNLNVISDLNTLGIYIAYILNRYQQRLTIFKVKIPPNILMFYLLLILTYTATRGSTLLLIIGFLFYTKQNWERINISKRIFYVAITSIFMIVFILENFLGILSNNFSAFDRLLNADYKSEGRYLQIIASWNNFIKNMWFGVGYNRAADNVFVGISRSNFQYTQILAAGGFILFATYFAFIFKMFYRKTKSRNNLIIFAMLLFALTSFIFRRSEMYHAIIAYIVYAESKLSKIN